MTAFTATRDVQAGAPAMWDLLVDWRRHAAWVPLTRMRIAEGDGASVGSVIIARTAIGPAGFDDVMRILAFRAPTEQAAGRVRIRHEGPVVAGEAEIEVVPVTAHRCVARWWEDVHLLPGLPRRARLVLDVALAPGNAIGGRLIFGRVLRLAAEQAETDEAVAAEAGS